MGPEGLLRSLEVDERRRRREAQRLWREFERLAKEQHKQHKLSEIELVYYEAEEYQNRLDVLLSVHKKQGPPWDWAALAAALPPPPPKKSNYHEIQAQQRGLVLPPQKRQSAQAPIEEAKAKDERAFQEALAAYAEETAEWEKVKHLAHRVLVGEHKAFIEALVQFSPLAEISDLGSLMHFTVEHSKLLRCELKVNGSQAIPSKEKILTATGKVSVKPMPKARFHEYYQDYVSGCMLRVAREVFAILPVGALLITASTDILDTRTGQTSEQPVLSAFMPRAAIANLDFEKLDPSDAVENFLHRGNFKASRKAGAFQPITPLTPADIPQICTEDMGVADLRAAIRKMRGELQIKLAALRPTAASDDQASLTL
jgi:hypothetical protein